MTDIDALKSLLAKVEAGEWDAFWDKPRGTAVHSYQFEFDNAYNGSLDAAKALHEAVLPGLTWSISGPIIAAYTVYVSSGGHGILCANNAFPARAWLIAILKALIAQAETTKE